MHTPARIVPGAAVALALASACSSPPRETPPAAPLRPSASVAAAAPPTARPAPKTTGIPVVVAQRKRTTLTGREWAWLLPEARLVTLGPEDAAGHREIWGPVFIA